MLEFDDGLPYSARSARAARRRGRRRRVAARKVTDLLEAGAQIIRDQPDAASRSGSAGRAASTCVETAYAAGDAGRADPLGFARCWSSPPPIRPKSISRSPTKRADLGILVNGADDGSGHDFSSMAAIRRGEITIARQRAARPRAGGASARESSKRDIGEEYATLARWLGELRPLVQGESHAGSAARTLARHHPIARAGSSARW